MPHPKVQASTSSLISQSLDQNLLSEDVQLALNRICQKDGGGFTIREVQLALQYTLKHKLFIYVPGIDVLSGPQAVLSFDKLRSDGYTQIAFAFQVNKIHQVAVWVDLLADATSVTILDSFNEKLTPEAQGLLSRLFARELTPDSIAYKNVLPGQKDEWSCGVYVFASLLKLAGEDADLVNDTSFNPHSVAPTLYQNYQRQAADIQASELIKVEHAHQHRMLLDKLERYRDSKGNYLSNKSDILKSLADFLQIVCWGNLDRRVLTDNDEQKGRLMEASADAVAMPLYELYDQYVKENSQDKFGHRVLAIAILCLEDTSLCWPAMFELIENYSRGITEASQHVVGLKSMVLFDIKDNKKQLSKIIIPLFNVLNEIINLKINTNLLPEVSMESKKNNDHLDFIRKIYLSCFGGDDIESTMDGIAGMEMTCIEITNACCDLFFEIIFNIVDSKKNREIYDLRKEAEKSKIRQTRIDSLFFAISNRRIDFVRRLLSNDRAIEIVNATDEHGASPLSRALGDGDTSLDIVILLIEKGANIDAPSRHGIPVLLLAFEKRYANVVSLLLEKGANVNAADSEGNTVLYLACVRGDIETVRLVLKHNADVNGARAHHDHSPLLRALELGHTDIAQLLIEGGADVNATYGYEQKPPLFLALEKGYTAIAQLLIDKGANINATDGYGASPLSRALGGGDISLDIAILLIEKGANIDATSRHGIPVLLLAFEKRYTNVVSLLLEKGANVNATDREGNTVLHLACIRGDIEAVRLVLKHNVDVNVTRDHHDHSPLLRALELGHTDIAQLLIEGGADVNATYGYEQKPPLFLALEKGYTAIAQLLIERGADVNATYGYEQNTPLFLALEKGYTAIAQLLIERGADFRKVIREVSALQAACIYGYIKIVQLLLEKEADVSVPNEEGDTLLHCACVGGHIEIVQLLLEMELEVNVTGKQGRTPLHYACMRGHVDVAKLLMRHGANLNVQDEDGNAPLHHACLHGHIETVQLLLNHDAEVNATNKGKPQASLSSVYHLSLGLPSKRYVGSAPLLLALTSTAHNNRAYTDAIAKLLIERGANVKVTDNEHRTPLQIALRRGYADTVQLLLEKDPDFRAKESQASLHDAFMWGHVKSAPLLLARGADVNVPDEKGNTQLHYACICGHVDVVQWLLKNGAKVNVTNREGDSPLLLTLTHHRYGDKTLMVTIAKLLLEQDAFVSKDVTAVVKACNLSDLSILLREPSPGLGWQLFNAPSGEEREASSSSSQKIAPFSDSDEESFSSRYR